MSISGSISAEEHYALQMMLCLAETYYTKQSLTLNEISLKEHISLKYLEQIVVPFRKKGWLKSQIGRNGGYIMIKDPSNLSLLDMINCIKGKSSIVSCLDHNSNCPLSGKCMSKKAWFKVQKAIENTMGNISIKSLLE